LHEGFHNRQVARQLIPATALGLFAILLLGLPKAFSHRRPQIGAVVAPAASQDLPQAVARSIDGARVAMGDRAGSFAYHYPGSVNQLEGIMNDDQYFRTLRNKTDVKALLCERNVQFLVAYETDLPEYKMHLVHTIRPELSQYPAPGIPVFRDDQIARLPDLSPDRPAEGTTYLYVWKLRCGSPETPGS
jgi:hypothetical protein